MNSLIEFVQDVIEEMTLLEALFAAIAVGLVLLVVLGVLHGDNEQAQRCELAWSLARNAQDSLQALSICTPEKTSMPPVFIVQ